MKKVQASVAVLIGVLNALVLLAQTRKEQTLSLSVRSGPKAYSINENIQLEIQLENVGSDSVLVCRCRGWGVGRMDVQVFDSNGRQVTTSFFADELPPTPREKDFIELKPHEFFGVRLDENSTHFVNGPGRYDFLVEYTSWVGEGWAKKYLHLPHLELWSRERGALVSNKVRIEVTE